MSFDDQLASLAGAAGIALQYEDVHGQKHEVAPPTLRAVLGALGYDTHSEAALRDSHQRASQLPEKLPPLITASAGHAVRLPARPARTKLTLEDGRQFDGHAEASDVGSTIPAILEPGYHRLAIGDEETVIAVAPQRCTTLHDLIPGGRALALAVQLYALRRHGDAGIGDWEALAEFVLQAGAHGVDAVAISPTHAQFSADTNRFAPYAPSSRVAYNVLHSASDSVFGLPSPPDATWRQEADRLEAEPLVNWPQAAALRLRRFRTLYDQVRVSETITPELAAYRAAQGEILVRHAIFEALHQHFLTRNPPVWNWREWPEPYRNAASPEVAAFARAHEAEIDFHIFLQFLANRGIAGAQAAARHAGMAIGLIADLAVGTDGGGSHCWSRPAETLLGLTIGAPPDLFQASGQNWGLAAFSPKGLKDYGFQAFLEMIRAALAHAGGVRIDHGMGLNRLWVVPEGAKPAEGAYLNFPEQDLLRLLQLESQRHKAIVVAEDLGTVPHGFTDRLSDAGIYGMRVLWFERDREGRFTNPAHWTRQAASMTTTHDLPTVAGWWSGRDNEWRQRLHADAESAASADAERQADREKLWQAMQQSGAAETEAPPADHPAQAVTAAIGHVGRSASDLMILPIEDALGLEEQPNLPNTTDEHPNWRRRLPGNAAAILQSEDVRARLHAALKGRGH